LASSPARKRAVAASRTVVGETAKRPAARTTGSVRGFRAPAPIIDDEAPVTNYALKLTEDLVSPRPADAVAAEGDFAARMAEALRAISAAHGEEPLAALAEGDRARIVSSDLGASPAVESLVKRAASVATTDDDGAGAQPPQNSVVRWLKALDKMPPIRLPIGPAIPWRFGLPALVALVVLIAVIGRPTARADAQGVRLPAQETYAVQHDAPLFTQLNPETPAEAQPQSQGQPSASQPIGVQEPAGAGFDVFDVGFKMIAVLALMYGSLMLLKRTGMGGASIAGKPGSGLQGMRVVSTLALAPNRTVHVIRVPGGRTLLVGATPNSINLLVDLGVLSEEETPEAASFLDVVKARLT